MPAQELPQPQGRAGAEDLRQARRMNRLLAALLLVLAVAPARPRISARTSSPAPRLSVTASVTVQPPWGMASAMAPGRLVTASAMVQGCRPQDQARRQGHRPRHPQGRQQYRARDQRYRAQGDGQRLHISFGWREWCDQVALMSLATVAAGGRPVASPATSPSRKPCAADACQFRGRWLQSADAYPAIAYRAARFSKSLASACVAPVISRPPSMRATSPTRPALSRPLTRV